VEIVIANAQAAQKAAVFRDLCLRNGIDVLADFSPPEPVSVDEIPSLLDEKLSDYILLVDIGSAMLYPDEVQVTQHNFSNIIHSKWDRLNYNLTVEQIELISLPEFEQIITKLTPLENIPNTVGELQNETANVLASLSLNGCRAQPGQLFQLRQNLIRFFARLSLAHSIITDLPLYSPVKATTGFVLEAPQPPPSGLSLPMQRMLSYLLERNLTQIHVCLSHVNKMLGEFTHTPATCFTLVAPGSASLHPSPLCAPDAASVCNEESPRMRSDYARGPEPEVTLEVRTPYSISFREGNGLDTSPFSRRGP
jgi:hypothetical protein